MSILALLSTCSLLFSVEPKTPSIKYITLNNSENLSKNGTREFENEELESDIKNPIQKITFRTTFKLF